MNTEEELRPIERADNEMPNRHVLRKQCRLVLNTFALLVSAILPSQPVMAQYLGGNGTHIDITIQENVDDGRLSIHGFDFDVLPQFGIVEGKRAFVRGIEISGNSLLSQDPGFVTRSSAQEVDPAGLIPPAGGEGLLFNVLSPPLSTMPSLGGRQVSHWDGQTFPVSWGPTPDADEGVRILKGSFFNPTNDFSVYGSETTDVEGFSVATANSSGIIHQHLKWVLLPDNGALPPSGPDNGVYLMMWELSYPSYAEWIPIFIGVEAFVGGRATQIAALDAIEAELQRPLCSDGIDNDKDGTIDLDDEGCEDADDMSERGAITECDNGIDDDGDGFVDFHDLDRDGLSDYRGDSSCLHPTNARELVPEPQFLVGLALGFVGLAGSTRKRHLQRRTC